MIRHIAIHGLAGTGKDTSANFLTEQHGYLKVAIADVLRAYLEEINPLVVRERDARVVPLQVLLAECGGNWDTAKRANPHVRETLKKHGQGARDVFGDDFWVNRFVWAYDFLIEEHFPGEEPHTVITDLRYENELTVLRHRFPEILTVKIIRPGHSPDGHPSEAGLPDEVFDAVVENDGTVSDLYRSLAMILSIHNAAEEVAV
ncbi:hypothetical protein [Streptomyces sp. NPDC017448]|uniref:deoxynucleotide monophosphate kinase family protein n=1 Tax=Streptomyces sp. NPDC017448 TaxID=3364996 RepID=UPI00378B726A